MEHLGVLILIAGVALPLLLIRFGHSTVSPLVLIWVSQTMPIGIALLNFTGEMRMPRLITWLVLGLSLIGILLGWLVASIMAKSSSPPRRIELSRKRLAIVFAILSALYFLSIAQGAAQYGFPLLSSKPDEARSVFMVGKLQNIFFSAGIPMFILGIHIFRISREWWLRIFVACAVIGLVVTYLLIGSRFMTLVWLSMALVYWDLQVRRLPLLKIASILVVFLLVFAIVGYFRYGKLLAVASGSPKLLEMGVLVAIESIYSYIANAYWNLDYALHLWSLGALRIPTWGLSTNEGVLWVLGFVPDLQQAYGLTNSLNADVTLKSGLNATSYHWGLFKDAMLLGPVFGSFAMGWLLTFLHGTRCRNGDTAGILVYGLLAYFVLGSFNLLASVIPTPMFGMGFLLLALYLGSTPREKNTR